MASNGTVTRHGSGELLVPPSPGTVPDEVKGRWLPSWLLRHLRELPEGQWIGWDEE